MARDEISAEVARREAGTSSIAEVFSGAVVPPAGAGGDVTRAWYAANGDIERAHTTGTFVREPRRGESGPVLVVYVDSRARVTDFSANSEVYLARLAQVGLNFAEVRFRQSKRPRGSEPRKVVPTRRDERPARELPELTPEEEHDAQALLAHVPETLKDSVSRALRVSMRAEKRRNS